MKRRWCLALAVVALAVVALLLFRGFWRVGEPIYQGHTVSWWLNEQLHATDMPRVREAFRRMGPGAVPYIIDRFKATDSGMGKTYRYLCPRLPGFIQFLVPTKLFYMNSHAAYVFGAIGPVAIPQLVPHLHDKNVRVRELVLTQLLTFESEGSSAAVALSEIIPLLKDPRTRQSAAQLLAAIGPPASDAVPALVACLNPNNLASTNNARLQAQMACERALGKIGPNAGPALPLLARLAQHTNRAVRLQAMIASSRIGGRTTNTIPWLLIELNPTGPPSEQTEILAALGEMGRAATSATSAISRMMAPYVELLTSRERFIQELKQRQATNPGSGNYLVRLGYDPEDDYRLIYCAATNALRKIDPASAQRLIPPVLPKADFGVLSAPSQSPVNAQPPTPP